MQFNDYEVGDFFDRRNVDSGMQLQISVQPGSSGLLDANAVEIGVTVVLVH